MKLDKIKYTKTGKPYFQYWTDSAVRKGNRKKGYWVRTPGKILDCPVCGTRFFTSLSQIKKYRVNTCSTKCAGKLRTGKNNSNWNGGRVITKGYVLVTVPPGYPNRDKRGYIPEHRLVMEKCLGRHLEPWEIVHHINHNKQDNRIENLKLYSNTHPLDVDTKLKDEIRRLRCLLKEYGVAY
jgi:hypothetical protein